MLNHHHSFCAFVIAFIIGATAVQFCPTLAAIQLVLFVVGIIAFLLMIKNHWFIIIVGFCLGFHWLAWQVSQQLWHQFPAELEKQPVVVQGQVLGLPEYKKGNIAFHFYVKQLLYEGKVQLENIKIRLSCYRCQLDIKPNQQWQFVVKLKKPHGFASWGTFDYEKYLFRHNIIARGYVRDSQSNRQLKTGNRYSLQKIHLFRNDLSNYINDLLIEMPKSAATVKALLLGDKTSLSRQQYQVLQRTGLNHLFAISGLHIGLIFLLVRFLSKYLLSCVPSLFVYQPRQHIQNACALLCAFFYSALAGFAIPTQRALLMLTLYTVLNYVSRYTSLLQVLLVSALLIILFDANAVMDMGFWLSFTAVLIIFFSLQNTKKISLFALQPRLCLGMAPLLLLFFGSVSLIAPIMNLIIIPIFTVFLIPILLFCFVCLLTGLTKISDSVFLQVANLLEYGWQGLLIISQLPFVELTLPAFSPAELIVLALIIIVLIQPIKLPARYYLLLLLPFLFVSPTKENHKKYFSVTMLDVGQGLSIVIQTQNHVLVYDTGAKFSADFNAADAVLIPYLRQQRIESIDTVVISHADNDHIGGYAALREKYKLNEVFSSRVDRVPSAQECITGQLWQFDQVIFEMLGPEQQTPQGSNNRSCVLKIYSEYGSALITGDIEHKTEKFMLRSSVRGKLSSQLMLIPHQGSKTSSTTEFLEAVNPELAIVSAGYLNQYGHPNKQIMQRYKERQIPVLNNVDSGSIRIEFTKQGMKINEYRKQNKRFW